MSNSSTEEFEDTIATLRELREQDRQKILVLKAEIATLQKERKENHKEILELRSVIRRS